jgi:protein-disulfide isomerase
MNKKTRKVLVGLGILGAILASVALGRRAPAFSGNAPAFRQSGPSGARVTVTEYSDFQCPKCAEAVPILKGLMNTYAKEARLVFHHAPLKQHTWAVLAAQAAEAAGLQGKFWEYAERLFAQQTKWSGSENPRPLFQLYAKDLGLDAARFAKDIDSPRVVEAVRKDKLQADAIAIPATPTFFINDRMLVGDTQLAGDGARYIERELSR